MIYKTQMNYLHVQTLWFIRETFSDVLTLIWNGSTGVSNVLTFAGLAGRDGCPAVVIQ